jgi:hypothetical protein
VLRLKHCLDRALGGAVRPEGAGMGNQDLFRRIGDKAAAIADPEAERDDAAEVPIALALVPLDPSTRSRMRSRSASGTADRGVKTSLLMPLPAMTPERPIVCRLIPRAVSLTSDPAFR